MTRSQRMACYVGILLLCVASVRGATVALSNITQDEFGVVTGLAQGGTMACVLESRLSRVLSASTQEIVCGDLPADHSCSTPQLLREVGGNASMASLLKLNVSLRNTSYNLTEASLGFPAPSDRDDVASWFATIQLSRLNVSSTCMCIDHVYLVTTMGRVVEDGTLLPLLSGPNASTIASAVLTSCVFGVGLGTNVNEGAGPPVVDRLMFDPVSRAVTMFQDASELDPTLRAAWSSAQWADVVDSMLTLGNGTTMMQLARWQLIPASPAAQAMMEIPSGSLSVLWFGQLMFCNSDVTELRYISTGVEHSSGVVVAVDWALVNIYAIMPVEMAKAISTRSRSIAEKTCALHCATTSINENSLLFAQAPCQYRCDLVAEYQPNGTTTASQREALRNLLPSLFPPLYLQLYDDATSAIPLNLTYFISYDTNQSIYYMSFTTWLPYTEFTIPRLLLGARFFKASTNGRGEMKYLLLDRIAFRVGLAPASSSALLSPSTWSDVCTPTPSCSDNEVLVTEINICVSVVCSEFIFMEIDESNGNCNLRSNYLVSAGILLFIAGVGELVVMHVTTKVVRRLRHLQSK